MAQLETLRLTWRGQQHFLPWGPGELPLELLDEHGRLTAFERADELHAAVSRLGMRVRPGLRRIDLDRVLAWIEEPKAATVDARGFLDAWHCFRELAATGRLVGAHGREQMRADEAFQFLTWKDAQGELTAAVYDKLYRTGRTRLIPRRPLSTSTSAEGGTSVAVEKLEPDADAFTPRDVQRLAKLLSAGAGLLIARLGGEPPASSGSEGSDLG